MCLLLKKFIIKRIKFIFLLIYVLINYTILNTNDFEITIYFVITHYNIIVY